MKPKMMYALLSRAEIFLTHTVQMKPGQTGVEREFIFFFLTHTVQMKQEF